jgi:hypothetical protein
MAHLRFDRVGVSVRLPGFGDHLRLVDLGGDRIPSATLLAVIVLMAAAVCLVILALTGNL